VSAAQATPRASAGSGTTLLTADEARALADRVLKLSTADATRVTIASTRSGNTRFADASISTSGQRANTSMTVTVTVGRRRAQATTNVLDDAALKRTVDLALRLARLAPEDPELMPELGAQTYANIEALVMPTRTAVASFSRPSASNCSTTTGRVGRVRSRTSSPWLPAAT